MFDSFRVRTRLDAGGVERVVIVGGGYIGLEMADAFVHRGLRVDDLNDLDLSYTPPVGAPWDAVQKAALTWCHSARGEV
jgi:hypothetical protein